MMTIIASNLGKAKARRRSAVVLDQYLNRVGVGTWAGYLSREGLEAMLDRLKAGASRHTAVQVLHEHAHRFEPVALIGNRKRFQDGIVSVGKTLTPRRHVTPRHMRILRKIAELSALWHDTGKLFDDFQGMVRGTHEGPHALRHYSASFLTLKAWLEEGQEDGAEQVFSMSPMAKQDVSAPVNSELLSLVAAIVLTHHCLPHAARPGDPTCWRQVRLPDKSFGTAFSERRPAIRQLDLAPLGERWQSTVTARVAQLRELEEEGLPDHVTPWLFYVARTAMMLADHAESALETTPEYNGPKDSTPEPGVAYAKSSPFIPLTDHLRGVTGLCGSAVGALLNHEWPRVGRRPAALGRRPSGPFAWQYHAEQAVVEQEITEEDGFFGVMLAGTGSGKTQAGYRIMNALAQGEPRFTLGLGFGALAIQSGLEYRREIGLDQQESALFVGRRHAAALRKAANALPEDGPDYDIEFEMLKSVGQVDHQLPRAVALALQKSPAARKLLSTPVACLTIDHIMEAMEANRGGFVAAALRVATADLLIDEIDSFSLSDIHAIGRLVYIAGMFGRKVVLSSATITPQISQALYAAYRRGHDQYRSMTGKGRAMVGLFVDQGAAPCVQALEDGGEFATVYEQFTESVHRSLVDTPQRRRMNVFEATPDAGVEAFYAALFGEAHRLGQEQGTRLAGEAHYAAGFVRFNLVKSAMDFVAWVLANHDALEQQHGIRVRLNYYGAGLDSITRQMLEERFAQLFNRKTDDYLDVPELAETLAPATSVLYLVVTTPIIEVGRDYDFDFAILEPCSDMSIIQSAGRVLRHRRHARPEPANVSLMPFSLRAFSARRGLDACLYGHRGPGVEQRDPVTDDIEVDHPAMVNGVWRLPKGRSAADLFGHEVYREGIHAGYRVHEPVTPADQLEREVQRHILLNPGSLTLASFVSHPNPFLTDLFAKAVPFRISGDDTRPRYTYRYDGEVFRRIEDPAQKVAVNEQPCPDALLFRPVLKKGAELEVRRELAVGESFAAYLGVR